MSLRSALRPLLSADGLVALLVLTEDGLPVEMFGYGIRAEHLAAELAGVARSARGAFAALGLGEPSGQRISAGSHNVDIFPVADHYLAVITDRGRSGDILPLVNEGTLAQLRSALRGEW